MKFQLSDYKHYIKTLSNRYFSYLNRNKVKKSKLRGIVCLGTLNKIANSYLSGKVNVGNNVKIIDSYLVGNIDVGDFSSINGPNTDIFSRINFVKIGKFCSIARNVSIQEFNHKTTRLTNYFINQNLFNGDSKNDIESKGDIIIENDVWVGTQSVILSGAKIHSGAIIASNSVVLGEIPPYAIVAGSPAKVIKYRFNDKMIKELLDLEWWNVDVEKLKKAKEILLKEDFSIEDIEKFRRIIR